MRMTAIIKNMTHSAAILGVTSVDEKEYEAVCLHLLLRLPKLFSQNLWIIPIHLLPLITSHWAIRENEVSMTASIKNMTHSAAILWATSVDEKEYKANVHSYILLSYPCYKPRIKSNKQQQIITSSSLQIMKANSDYPLSPQSKVTNTSKAQTTAFCT